MDSQAGVTWGFVWNPAVAMAGLGSLGYIHRHKGDSVVQGFACHVPKHLVHPLSPSASRHPPGALLCNPPTPSLLTARPSFTLALPAFGASSSGFAVRQMRAGVWLPVCCCVTPGVSLSISFPI